MEKQNYKELPGWEEEVKLWIEQESSVMVKAISKFGDPVELTSEDARNFASILNEAADNLDRLDDQ